MITLTNKSGASVSFTEIGAGIVSMVVPDEKGQMTDIVLGYKSDESYLGDGPCAGKIPGRYANRIARGLFTLEGRQYKLDVNNGPNHLHGGFDGFSNRKWNYKTDNKTKVSFYLTSPDGDQGYPSRLDVVATYSWSDDCTLTLDIAAQSDGTTILNLTNHTYWNLSGEDSGSVLGHHLQLFASHYLPTDDTLIPTGEIADVAGTPMDFTSEKVIGEDIKADFPALKYGKGYDNCWVIDGINDGKVKKAAILTCPCGKRKLEISTNQPAVQVYTGNWLEGSPRSKSGRGYHDYDGVAIECQSFPDSPNHDNFPSTVLHKGEMYHRIIKFRYIV